MNGRITVIFWQAEELLFFSCRRSYLPLVLWQED